MYLCIPDQKCKLKASARLSYQHRSTILVLLVLEKVTFNQVTQIYKTEKR
jgi:hypothetical protein